MSLYYGEDGAAQAIEDLEANIEDEADEEALDLVTYLLRTKKADKTDALRAVCAAACQWGDASIWTQAVDACTPDTPVSVFGAVEWINSVEKFGLQNVRHV
jgi:hypothetical protein